MQTVKFIREPGYIYDLFTLFRLRFNQPGPEAGEKAGETARIFGEFSEFNEDLRLFFLQRDNGACFMLQGILHKPDVLWALFITNLITTICCIIIFGIKVYNDYFKKKASEGNGGGKG